jgi:hypothetical protein
MYVPHSTRSGGADMWPCIRDKVAGNQLNKTAGLGKTRSHAPHNRGGPSHLAILLPTLSLLSYNLLSTRTVLIKFERLVQDSRFTRFSHVIVFAVKLF